MNENLIAEANRIICAGCGLGHDLTEEEIAAKAASFLRREPKGMLNHDEECMFSQLEVSEWQLLASI